MHEGYNDLCSIILLEEEWLKKTLHKDIHNNYIYLDLKYNPSIGCLSLRGKLLNIPYFLHGVNPLVTQTDYFIQII